MPTSPAQSAQSPSSPAQPPPYGSSDLERRAAEVRAQRTREKAEQDRFTAQQKAEAATFRLALSRSCPDHNAAPGKPCWRLPLDEKHHRAGRGVCGARVGLARGVARIQASREARQAREQQQARQRTAGQR